MTDETGSAEVLVVALSRDQPRRLVVLLTPEPAVTTSNPATSPLLVGLLTLASCAGSEGTSPDRTSTHQQRRRHDGGQHPHDRWADALDDPGRDAWQKPAEVVAALAPAEGMVVVDVGAGTGYFEPHLSRAVGESGRVLALDIDPALVTRMQGRFAEEGLVNVEARLVSPSDPDLATESVDRVLIVDTWHHMEARVPYARRLREALRPSGRIVVVDYPTDAPKGPPPELRVSPEAVVAELEAAGFRARVLPDTLPDQFVVIGDLPERANH